MNKTQAIKFARSQVSRLSKFGENCWGFMSCDPSVNAWRDSVRLPYYGALAARSQTLLDIACKAMDSESIQYCGDYPWFDYLPKECPPTLAELREAPLKSVRGKIRTGAARGIRYKIAECSDAYASSAIVADVLGERVVIRSCDAGQWDQFIHRGC